MPIPRPGHIWVGTTSPLSTQGVGSIDKRKGS
jgi:hypothetical protein